jgi:Glycosyl hydrolase family 26
MTEARYVSARLFTDAESVEVPQKDWDVKVNSVCLYKNIKKYGSTWLYSVPKDVQIILVLEMFDSIERIRDGCFDSEVKILAKEIKASGRSVWIRPLHEFNLEDSTYPWCLYPYTDDKISSFKKAWMRVVKGFRESGASVKFQLCYNAKNPRDDKTPYSKFYPGSEYVDHVGVDVYNRTGLSKYHTQYVPLKDLLAGPYEQLKGFKKPIFIGEMSTTDVGGNKALWIRDAWKCISDQYKLITIAGWFFEDKSGGRRWGLHTPEEIEKFRKGASVWLGNKRTLEL